MSEIVVVVWEWVEKGTKVAYGYWVLKIKTLNTSQIYLKYSIIVSDKRCEELNGLSKCY